MVFGGRHFDQLQEVYVYNNGLPTAHYDMSAQINGLEYTTQ